MRACCTPTLLGWFAPERGLTKLYDRHRGVRCIGALDELDIKEWWSTGERLVVDSIGGKR